MAIVKSILSSAVCFSLLLSGSSPALAGTPCIEAVFFDLGNTLASDRGDGIFELREGAVETIDGLQAAGVRLGIITNVPAGWDIDDLRALLEEPDFLNEFEVVILSSEAPAPKPSPLIYTFAHESLAEPRPPITSTAFVGETLSEIADREIDPTRGARSVGMIGIHLSNLPPSPLTDYTIPTNDLPQVIAIVDDTCNALDAGTLPLASDATRLLPPVPNPFGASTRIGFSVAAEQHVQLGIFDASGRHVVQLVDGIVTPGIHDLLWDGRDGSGNLVSGGVYYSRMLSGGELRSGTVIRLE